MKLPGGKKADHSRNALAMYVMDRLVRSRDAWAPEYRKMRTCARLIRGMPYDVEDEDELPGMTFPVVPAIAGAIDALLQDVFGSAIDAPFTLKPTPLPTLPPDVVAWIKDQLMRPDVIQHLQELTGGDMSKVPAALQGLNETVKDELNKKAQDAAASLSDDVKSRLQTSGWLEEFKAFLTNYVTYPVAVMKGPSLRTQNVRVWDKDTNRLTFQEQDVWVVENVNPFAFYPAPYAKDAQSGEYCIEVRRTTAVDFAMLARTEGFSTDAVLEVQQTNPEGCLEEFFTGDQRDPDRDLLQFSMPESLENSGYYDVVWFYGRISGRQLNAAGGYDLNAWEWYEAEVAVCANVVIRAVLNPRPDGKRPFWHACFQPVPGNFFGESVPSRLFDIQRSCEAALRNLIRNMSFAAGPITEVNGSKIAEDEDPLLIEPLVVKLTKSGMPGDNSPAYRFHDIPSHSNELMAVFQQFLDLGFQILGFSRMSLGGSPDPSVGRTQGGMSLMLNQASKPLKKMVGSLGTQVIAPIVQSLVDTALMTSDDPSIRGDINVVPTGVDGLADNEARAQRILMAMQNTAAAAPFLQQPGPMYNIVLSLLTAWFKSEGLPTDALPDQSGQQAFARDTGAAYTPGGGMGMDMSGQPNAPAPAPPELDGRSGAAVGAIGQANNQAATMGGRAP